MYEIMLMRKAQGWFTGYNSNVDGHERGTIRYFVYNGGTPKYRQKITEVARGRLPRPDVRLNAAPSGFIARDVRERDSIQRATPDPPRKQIPLRHGRRPATRRHC